MIIPLLQDFLGTSKRIREIDFEIYGLEEISSFVTRQQSINGNNSYKWLHWVTKTKIQILSYTNTLPIMLVEILKETILCHTRHENAHTSKIEWPRCTKVKLVFKRTYLCHLGKSHVQLLNIKSNFLFHEFSIWSPHKKANKVSCTSP